jgi:nicotinate phosphoribosyltransferase
MAHSWVQMFDSEEEAFRQYARLYPDKCVLLVDTYDVLKSGIPNAIRVFKEEVIAKGFKPGGIRIDSGDMTYLSKAAKKMLTEAGLGDCKIVASNSLDETIIRDTLQQGACIDVFGVGERLITSKSEPVFGGVYKLVAVEDDDGGIVPKIKISENVTKITTPHFKKIYRLYEKSSNKAIADVLTLHNETIDDTRPYRLFDPDFTWKTKVVRDFWVRDLMEQIFDNGKLVYRLPSIDEIRNYCKEQINTLWDEVLRFENPHNYYVDLSLELWKVKERLLNQNRII